MDLINNEKYLINKVRDSDPVTAKAWILAAKTLYPKDFGVQVNFVFNVLNINVHICK